MLNGKNCHLRSRCPTQRHSVYGSVALMPLAGPPARLGIAKCGRGDKAKYRHIFTQTGRFGQNRQSWVEKMGRKVTCYCFSTLSKGHSKRSGFFGKQCLTRRVFSPTLTIVAFWTTINAKRIFLRLEAAFAPQCLHISKATRKQTMKIGLISAESLTLRPNEGPDLDIF